MSDLKVRPSKDKELEEGNAREEEDKSGEVVAFDRKSPSFAKNAKDGAPSSSTVK